MRIRFAILIALAVPALAQDVPFIKPYPGSTLSGKVAVAQFHEYQLLAGPAGAKPQVQKIGGRVTRMLLRGPKDRGLFEIFSNYEEALRKDGFSTIFKCAKKECGSGRLPEMDTTFTSSVEQYYLAAKKNRPEGPLYIAVMVNDVHNPAVRVHVIEAGTMQTGMVKVTADQMSKDLAATGKVVLYSILFDTGKADVKPESDATIAEVAKFLAANASVKIYVVGHTDNVGTYDANADLSKRRAEAVVKVLTTKHGIAAARLRGIGVASVAPVATNRTAAGRQLNRRVELVEQ
jgi:outer membrane protein OmpA-like peptidoglycan-associated protein